MDSVLKFQRVLSREEVDRTKMESIMQYKQSYIVAEEDALYFVKYYPGINYREEKLAIEVDYEEFILPI